MSLRNAREIADKMTLWEAAKIRAYTHMPYSFSFVGIIGLCNLYKAEALLKRNGFKESEAIFGLGINFLFAEAQRTIDFALRRIKP